ncbi:MAG: glutathione synthase [Heliobacteriaceae bacterium]|jgi:glutathione synthase|nr:glutathione synthase [Heliobacteriaceae bacterium]
MNILFIIDRIELKHFEFNDLVTNFSLIKEFLDRNETVCITTIDDLSLKSGTAYADCRRTFEKDGNIFCEEDKQSRQIEDFQLVMFRHDPPVDMDYINSTYIFDFVDTRKTVVLNNPSAVRDFNEKLHAVRFKDLMPANIVTSSQNDILGFLDEHNEIILKPLNGCFGKGVMYIKRGDKNTRAIINSITNSQTTLIMVQKYIPQGEFGDKRVLFLGGEVLDYCVQKLPDNNDFKFNQHCDKNIMKAVLSDTEKAAFTPIAKELNRMGLPLAGLDVIDGQIIEINVTSPCYFIREINNHFGVRLEKQIADFIISKVISGVPAASLTE